MRRLSGLQRGNRLVAKTLDIYRAPAIWKADQ
jgi:hypothetical protein